MNIFKSTKHNLLAAIVVLATSYGAAANATSFTTEANIGQSFPANLQGGAQYLATIDTGFNFNAIEKVCITAEVNSGTATHAILSVAGELIDEPTINSSLAYILLQEVVAPTEENPIPSIKQLDLNFCTTDVLTSNLLDGESEFTLTINGGDLEINNLQVNIEGAVSTEHTDNELYTASFGNNLSYPLTLDNGQRLISETDIGYQFESIESVCIKGEVQSGTAGAFVIGSASEASNDVFRNTEVMAFILINENEFESCGVNGLLYNFLDGRSTMSIAPSIGNISLWDLKIEVKGVLKASQIRLTKNENSPLLIPASGGKLKYDMTIENLDSTQASKTFRKWSVLKLPNGDMYPHRKAKSIDVNYSEPLVLSNKRIKIPAWFEAGEYELWWYLTDAENNERIVDRLKFVKEEGVTAGL